MTRPTVRVDAARLTRLLDAAKDVVFEAEIGPDGTYQATPEIVARLYEAIKALSGESDKPEFCPNCRVALTVREEVRNA